jgi:hypothetical protein
VWIPPVRDAPVSVLRRIAGANPAAPGEPLREHVSAGRNRTHELAGRAERRPPKTDAEDLWGLRITIFTPRTTWLESAATPSVPGGVVVGGVAAFFLPAPVLAFWPTSRKAGGEFHGEEIGDWKNR